MSLVPDPNAPRYDAAARTVERMELSKYNRADRPGPHGPGGDPPTVVVRVTGPAESSPPRLAPAVILRLAYDPGRSPGDGGPDLWSADTDLSPCWAVGLHDPPADGTEGVGLVVDVNPLDGAPIVLIAGGGVAGGAADLHCRVVSGTNTSGYTVTRIVLTGANTFADFAPEDSFGNVFRWPTNPGVPLPNIPVGQTVRVQRGETYSTCEPWGGQITVNATVPIERLTTGSITGTVVCVDGVPVVTLVFTPTTVSDTLAVTVTGRDLAAAALSITPPPPPPPP